MRLQLAAGKGAAALGAVMMLGAALTLGGCKQKGEYPMSQSSFLLNTFVEVTVYDSSSFWASDARKALEGSIQLCSQYEQLLSRTIEGSDIYRLNHGNLGREAFRWIPRPRG